MITELSQLDPNGTYTYADYVTWKFTEFVELVRGHLVKMAAPKTFHQQISMFISSEISVYLRKKPCKVFAAPFDVRFTTNPQGRSDREIYTVVQPDICVICDSTKLDERGCIGAPDWIIEITSPGTLLHDRITKRELYESHGVGEYWIVYPNEKMVEVYRSAPNGSYLPPVIYSKDEEDVLSPALFPDLSLTLTEVFA